MNSRETTHRRAGGASRALFALVMLAGACGAPERYEVEPTAAVTSPPSRSDAPPPDAPPASAEPIDESEREAEPAYASELPLAGWISDEEGPFDRIVWDEDVRDALVFEGGPWGAVDQFEVTATLASAGASSAARFTIEASGCRERPPSGGDAGSTHAFGTTLRWHDVSDIAGSPGGCTVVASGIDEEAWANGTPVECPTTGHAYVAVYCSHRTCVRFGLFDDVPPSESALAQAVGRATFAWVSAPGPAVPCE